MSIARALSVLGAGLTGYAGGQDDARKQKRQESEDAWREKQRQRTETQWQREDEKYQREQAELEAQRRAAAPVEVQANVPGDEVGPTAYRAGSGGWTGDQAAAQGQAAAQNTPSARMGRAASVTADPVRAAQMQGQAQQAELGQMQLNAAKEAEATQRFDRDMTQALHKGGWEGITKFLSDSKADGTDGSAKFAFKKDGGNITVYRVGPDGTALDAGMTVPDNEEGKAKLAFTLSKVIPPAAKLKHYADEAKAERMAKKDEAAAAAAAKRADADMLRAEAASKRSDALMAKVMSSGGGGSGGAAAPGSAPVWDEKADTFLRQRYTINDPMTGGVSVDGAGLQFAKQVALAQSMRNGGDTTTALGYAFQIDNKIKEDAKGDPGKINEMRQGLLRMMVSQPGTPSAAPVPSKVPGPPTAAPAAPPRMAQSASTDPLAGKSRQQIRAMREELAAEISKWQGTPNAQGRVSELQTLIDRIDRGEY